jgi:hypothetical protein
MSSKKYQSLEFDASVALAVMRQALPTADYVSQLERLSSDRVSPEMFVLNAIREAAGSTPKDTRQTTAPDTWCFRVRPAYRDIIAPVLATLFVSNVQSPEPIDKDLGIECIVLQPPELKISKVVAAVAIGVDQSADHELHDTTKRNGSAYINQLVAIAVSALKGQTTRNSEAARSSIPFILKTPSGSYRYRSIGLLKHFDTEAEIFVSKFVANQALWGRLQKHRHKAKTTLEAVRFIKEALHE